MQIIYLFSGFKDDCGYPPEIAASLRDNIVDRTAITLIASDPADHHRSDWYSKMTIDHFRNAGIEFDNVNVLDDRNSADECVEAVTSAPVVYLMGGRCLLQHQFLLNTGMAAALRAHNGVILGRSAGAINIAKMAFLAPNDHKDGIKWRGDTIADIPAMLYQGTGLLDISVRPHYEKADPHLTDEVLIPFSHKIDIYAMNDDSAIVIKDGERQYFGEICLISKGLTTWIKQK